MVAKGGGGGGDREEGGGKLLRGEEVILLRCIRSSLGILLFRFWYTKGPHPTPSPSYDLGPK